MSGDRPRLVPAVALLPARAEPARAEPAGERRVPPGAAVAMAGRLARDPGRPVLTFYDDATGERVELSTATLDNWVAKTANMLIDTVGLVPGDRVAVGLPAHWLTSVILLASWSAGMDVVLLLDTDDQTHGGACAMGDVDPASVHVAFVAESRVDATMSAGIEEIVALSLRPLAGRLSHPIAGVLDYAAEVPAHGDRFAAPPPPPGQADLLRGATMLGELWELTAGDRILTTAAPTSIAGLLGTTLTPLLTDTSVVLCRNLDCLDPAAFLRRLRTERVTAVDATALGAAGPATWIDADQSARTDEPAHPGESVGAGESAQMATRASVRPAVQHERTERPEGIRVLASPVGATPAGATVANPGGTD